MTIAGAHHATEHFFSWLARGFSGCSFAAFLAKENEKARARDRILCMTFLGAPSCEDLPDIEQIIDTSAKNAQIALLLFPRLRTPEDVGALVRTLSTSDRWLCSRVEWGAQRQDGHALLALEWTTLNGAKSSAMGFAPFGSMPVTRRAPYVAVSLWAGGHENNYKPSTGDVVGFVDFPFPGKKREHDRLWDESRERVRELLSDPVEDVRLFRKAAFCVPTDVAEKALRSGSPAG